jgi:hypothetical protein
VSMMSSLGYTLGQCTDYVAKTLGWVPSGWGDAGQWLGNAHAQGYPESSSPSVGDIAVWGPNQGGALGAGHVAIVTGIQSDGAPIVSEENWTYGPYNPDTRNVSAQSAAGIIGYIGSKDGGTGMNTSLDGTGKTTTPTATKGIDLNPVDWLTGAPAFIGSAIGTTAGAAAGATVAGAASGLVGAGQSFFDTSMSPFFKANAIPLIVGIVVLYIMFGAGGTKQAADQGTTIVKNVVTGAGNAGKGARAGAVAARAAPLAAAAA